MRLSNQEFFERISLAFEVCNITPRDMGVTSRKVNYWKEQGLLPYVIDGKHLKMNIFQASWFHIVSKLSGLGISSDALKELGMEVWVRRSLFDQQVNAELSDPHSKLSKTDKEGLKSIQRDPIARIDIDRSVTQFTCDIARLFKGGLSRLDFNYFPESNDWEFTGNVLEFNREQPNRNEEPRIVIPLATIFYQLIAIELVNEGTCNPLLDESLSQLLDVVYRKKPKYVDVVIHGSTREFVSVHESTKSIEEIIRYVQQNDLSKGSSLVMTRRNANQYTFQIITKTT